MNPFFRTTAVCLVLALAQTAAAQETRWSETVQRVSTAIVTVLIDRPRSFDDAYQTTTQATGFVVDAEHGLILTNRHVVGPGPTVARAIFLNKEEVDLEVVYRDPINDFGFFRYDPFELETMVPAALELDADGARVGREIRVIGNDAGDRLSILTGTIARVDRPAPDYGRGSYNDFNTFYIQAASGASGGSSGSPVVDIDGRAIALNAGGKQQSLAGYYLPLHRVERAMGLILREEPISRGSLQTTFVHESFAELRRLGLTRETERRVRDAVPGLTGMLVVESVLASAPAAGSLKVGDVLLEVAEQLVHEFTDLAEALDGSVGQTLALTVERAGRALEFDLPVSDLHAITPDEYLVVGGAVMHPLSYQQARHFGRAIPGVYVADRGYLFRPGKIRSQSVITAIDGQATGDLDQLERALASVSEGAAAPVRWVDQADPLRERFTVVRFNRNWSPAERCAADGMPVRWQCRGLQETVRASGTPSESVAYPDRGSRAADRAAASLVRVDVDIPFHGIDGVWDLQSGGTGVVVDAGLGWVVTSRAVLPHAAADIRITLAESMEVPGKVEYIHPLHNLAVVSYDPAAVGSTPVRSAGFSPRTLAPGDRVQFAGFSGNDAFVYRPAQVETTEALNFVAHSKKPRVFRDFNLDFVSLTDAPEDATGMLLDRQGRVVALWLNWHGFEKSVHGGMASELVMEMLDRLRTGSELQSIETQWKPLPLSDARLLKVPQSWLERYDSHDRKKRQLLSVKRTIRGSPAAAVLREGDLLLGIDGLPASSFREVERLCQRPEVQLTVLRSGEALDLRVETVAFDGRGVDRVVFWAGATLVAPYRALLLEQGLEPAGVYASTYDWGSPAARRRLVNLRLTAVNDIPTPDLDTFVSVVKALPQNAEVRIAALDKVGKPDVVTLKLDSQFWPLSQLARNGDGWRLREEG